MTDIKVAGNRIRLECDQRSQPLVTGRGGDSDLKAIEVFRCDRDRRYTGKAMVECSQGRVGIDAIGKSGRTLNAGFYGIAESDFTAICRAFLRLRRGKKGGPTAKHPTER